MPLTLVAQFVGYRSLEVDVYDASEPVDIQLVNRQDLPQHLKKNNY
ncbi:hypothetical protein [Prevotella sp. E9-3]